MLRFRLNELIAECREQSPELSNLTIAILADEIGSNRSTLANLTTLAREPVTNTALFESLVRYFKVRLPNFEMEMLLEFDPPLTRDNPFRIDDIYPTRSNR